MLFVYAFNRKKNAKLYLACFKPQMLSSWAQKLKLNIHLTKSPDRDHIYKLCLYTLEEHKCLIQCIITLTCAKAEILHPCSKIITSPSPHRITQA